jgi:NADH-quinone oxidoreductase subunit H
LPDGLKLLVKEILLPTRSNKVLLLMAPIVSLTMSLLAWIAIPLSPSLVLSDLDLGLMWIILCSSLGVYGIIIAGWASNSKYAFYGAIRSISQMISYEVTLSLILLQIIILNNSLNLTEIVLAQEKIWNIIPLFPFFLLWTISSIAETNRPPFDLPEAESELVAGYFTEYTSMAFAVFQIAEYSILY